MKYPTATNNTCQAKLSLSELFKQSLLQSGISPPDEIIPDGNIHRFAVAGDKWGAKSGWYVLYDDEVPAGAYGDWRQDINEAWCSKETTRMTEAERAEHAERRALARRQSEAERKRLQEECGRKSLELWERGRPASEEHPYVARKGITPYGARQVDKRLLMPVVNETGALLGLQFIAEDGSKRFKVGTPTKGNFFLIGEPNQRILVCEGYATGCTLHEATGEAVAVAFNAGNLVFVAEVIKNKYKDLTVIVCADDDHMTDGNPGMTKASEAAKAVEGLLAVPKFKERGAGDTDFNDMARLEGLEAVKECVEAAQRVSGDDTTEDSFNEAVQRLASLSPTEYERIRKEEAAKLKIRTSFLDALIKEAQRHNKGEDLPYAVVEPWHETVDPAELLDDIAGTIRRFVVCEDEVAQAVALWCAFSWFIDVVQVAPLAIITSPEKRCGKTLLLSIMGKISARAIMTSNITSAAMFRVIEIWRPTLLIDETDAMMNDNEALRGVIDSGHTRDSAFTMRNVGDDFVPRLFSTWGAKVFSGIGTKHLRDTIIDRAIVLKLRRKMPTEKVERLRHAEEGLFTKLSSKLARFSEDCKEQVRAARPPLPESLNDRQMDNWEPLLSIAMVAGGGWLEKATHVALKLSQADEVSPSVGVELLGDIKAIFDAKGYDRIPTGELIDALCEDNEKRWATYNRGQRITPRQVASILRLFGITSKNIRTGDGIPKGFLLEQFKDAFDRYISSFPPITPLQSATPLQVNNIKDLGQKKSATEGGVVAAKKQANWLESLRCSGVADKKGVESEKKEKGHFIPPKKPLAMREPGDESEYEDEDYVSV